MPYIHKEFQYTNHYTEEEIRSLYQKNEPCGFWGDFHRQPFPKTSSEKKPPIAEAHCLINGRPAKGFPRESVVRSYKYNPHINHTVEMEVAKALLPRLEPQNALAKFKNAMPLLYQCGIMGFPSCFLAGYRAPKNITTQLQPHLHANPKSENGFILINRFYYFDKKNNALLGQFSEKVFIEDNGSSLSLSFKASFYGESSLAKHIFKGLRLFNEKPQNNKVSIEYKKNPEALKEAKQYCDELIAYKEYFDKSYEEHLSKENLDITHDAKELNCLIEDIKSSLMMGDHKKALEDIEYKILMSTVLCKVRRRDEVSYLSKARSLTISRFDCDMHYHPKIEETKILRALLDKFPQLLRPEKAGLMKFALDLNMPYSGKEENLTEHTYSNQGNLTNNFDDKDDCHIIHLQYQLEEYRKLLTAKYPKATNKIKIIENSLKLIDIREPKKSIQEINSIFIDNERVLKQFESKEEKSIWNKLENLLGFILTRMGILATDGDRFFQSIKQNHFDNTCKGVHETAPVPQIK